jgi:hypothetical protein
MSALAGRKPPHSTSKCRIADLIAAPGVVACRSFEIAVNVAHSHESLGRRIGHPMMADER